MSSEQTTRFRQKRKQDLVYVMGGKCILCGYDKCQQALEFHHIETIEKEYTLSSGNCRDWEQDIKEIQKCALLCSNCHKEVHVFNLKVWNTLDKNKVNEIAQTKKKQVITCLICGKTITHGSQYCPECYGFLKRKAERPLRQELKNLIREMPFTQIAKQFGVSDNAIRKWCLSEKLPKTKKEINSYSDDEWDLI